MEDKISLKVCFAGWGQCNELCQDFKPLKIGFFYILSVVCVSSFSRYFPIPFWGEQSTLDSVVSQSKHVQLQHDEGKQKLKRKKNLD